MAYDNSVWPAGKWKGTPIGDVPDQYLEWAAENMENSKLRNMASDELKERGLDVPKHREKDKTDELADRLMRKIGGLENQIAELGASVRKLLVANGVSTRSESKSSGVDWFDEGRKSARNTPDAKDNNDYRTPNHNSGESDDDTIPF